MKKKEKVKKIVSNNLEDEEDSEMAEEKPEFSTVPQQTTSKKPSFNELVGM